MYLGHVDGPVFDLHTTHFLKMLSLFRTNRRHTRLRSYLFLMHMGPEVKGFHEGAMKLPYFQAMQKCF